MSWGEMSWGEKAEFSLTLMFNKKKSKVLCASVDHTFADVLLSFLTVPMLHILQCLRTHCGPKAPTIGSLNTLDTAFQMMDAVLFSGGWNVKFGLLYPGSSLDYEERSKLKLDIVGSCANIRSTYFYTCGRCLSSVLMVSLYHSGVCSGCGKVMDKLTNVTKSNSGKCEVFAKQTNFLISDDMRMLPYESVRSLFQNLEKLGITDDMRGESREIKVRFKEIADLLKLMLLSVAPLTDLFLHKGEVVHQRSEQLSLWGPQLKDENCSSSKKMKITALVQKSSNKFLFVEAENDFVNFLFSLLSIPLGQVERLLNANSGLGSIDNLYSSIVDLNAEKWLTTLDIKAALINPKFPHKYLSNNLLSLEEKAKPKLYCHRKKKDHSRFYWSFSSSVCSSNFECHEVSFLDLKSQLGTCIEGNSMFMVTDDLTVTPLFFSAFMALGVPFTDIEFIDINIGFEEALSILKASLTSKCALSKGLKLNCTAPFETTKARTLKLPPQLGAKCFFVLLVSSLIVFPYVLRRLIL